MTQEEKRKFVLDLCQHIVQDTLAVLSRCPEEWDGHELRELILAKARNVTVGNCGIRGARLRDYKNEVLVRNLA